jgi:outer membrane protein
MKNTMKCILIPVVLACAATAHAQTAGTWMVRAGATTITPNVASGDLSPPSLAGSKAAIGNSTRFSGGITYMFNDNISFDLPVAVPFQHDISGDGAVAGVGKIADVKAAPVTLLAQWRFMEATSAFRPFVGLGITYASFYGARTNSTLTAITGGNPSNPTTISIDSKWAATVQLGATMAIDSKWYVEAAYTFTPLSTRATFSSGQTQDIRLDPSSVSLAVGYRF